MVRNGASKIGRERQRGLKYQKQYKRNDVKLLAGKLKCYKKRIGRERRRSRRDKEKVSVEQASKSKVYTHSSDPKALLRGKTGRRLLELRTGPHFLLESIP